jgi:hypothetical protein
MKTLYELIIVNWKTTTKAIVPLAAAVVARYGYALDTALVAEILAAMYTILLVFSKDAPKT